MSRKVVKIVGVIVAAIGIFMLGHVTTLHYSPLGTYSAGNEPDINNLYVVLQQDRFTIYNQAGVHEEGNYEPIEKDNDTGIYALTVDDQTTIGYIVQDKKRLTLLGFRDTTVQLEKIDDSAIFVNVQ
ncbi:MAG: hypothetical protein UDG94_01790 [Peptococcaceae bacterium]|nr:hypothetical protein [Peptococcaceae bacterium]